MLSDVQSSFLNALGFCRSDEATCSVELEGKGIGTIAIRDIKAGECLLSENPLVECDNPYQSLAIDGPPYPSASDMRDKSSESDRQLEKTLSANILKQLWDLSDCHPGAKSLGGIVGTNSFGDGERVRVFAKASRFNHSCSPNVDHFAGTQRRYCFVAARDIQQGEELCISYLRIGQLLQARADRQQDLERTHCFRCHCDACDGTTSDTWRSDDTRSRIVAFCQMSPEEWDSIFDISLFDRFLDDIRMEGLSLRSVVDQMESFQRVHLLRQLGSGYPEVQLYHDVTDRLQRSQPFISRWAFLFEWVALAIVLVVYLLRRWEYL